MPWLAQNTWFSILKDRKPGIFFDKKMLKPLSIKALIFYQQALINIKSSIMNFKGERVTIRMVILPFPIVYPLSLFP